MSNIEQLQLENLLLQSNLDIDVLEWIVKKHSKWKNTEMERQRDKGDEGKSENKWVRCCLCV